VLEVNPGEQYLVNKAPIAKEQLYTKLKEIYDPRPEKIIWFGGGFGALGSGSCTSNAFRPIGMITMKMMSSTRSTSIIGVRFGSD